MAEHATFLAGALLLWFPVVLPWPARAHASRWWIPPVLVAADLENTLYVDIASHGGQAKGRVTIALRPDLAPNHVARIKELAREGAYDGVVFHRVIDGFMAQTGCPRGTGTGGSQYNNLKAEFNAAPAGG